jgi:hypothetical protein
VPSKNMWARGVVVAVILLGILAAAAGIAIFLKKVAKLHEFTIAVIVLTICSSVADTLSVVRYLTHTEAP